MTRYVPEFKNLKVVQSIKPDGTMVLEDAKRPPTLRAMDAYKAAEAGVVLAGGTSDLLTREAELRGIPVTVLAQAVMAQAAKTQQNELDRVAVNIEVDAATDHTTVVAILNKNNISLPSFSVG